MRLIPLNNKYDYGQTWSNSNLRNTHLGRPSFLEPTNEMEKVGQEEVSEEV